VTHWARLLRAAGDQVTIILTHAEHQTPGLDPAWAAKYRAWGIDFIELHSDLPTSDRWPECWSMRLSEKVHPLLSEFDVVYFQDWANCAFHTVRVKRFSPVRAPVCVTVLHGPSHWVRTGNRWHPRIPEDLHLQYVERYSAQHSDFTIAPSRYIAEWAKREDMKFRAEPVVLGLPYLPAEPVDLPPQEPAKVRVIFFGRLEPRKGFTLFAKALRELCRRYPETAQTIGEIVLLGYEDERGSVEKVRQDLAGTGIPLVHVGDRDSVGAAAYLAQHAKGAVAVIASPYENFPYAVIETSLAQGLRMICSRGGGIPEILQDAHDERLFDPEPRSLAAKLHAVLTEGEPVAAAPYDYAAANAAWLAFHRRVVEYAEARKDPVVDREPSVCVCIPYFNKARYFPELLDCLAGQTLKDFSVVAIDDGSDDPEAIEVFDDMARKYEGRGWKFVRQENAFVDAARNAAARLADSEYLFFIDADELIPPHALRRMREAAVISGVDCVVSASILFSGDQPPYATVSRYMPIGPNLVAGLIEPIVFGGPMILVRRAAFEAVGGYREVRGAAHEDWELQARLTMRGFDCDILPEYLHQYRQLPDGLAKTSDGFLAKLRIIECYEEELSKIGLRGLAGAMYALYRRVHEVEGALKENVPNELRMRLHSRLSKMLGKAE
jgi:glycosyltransferase involved in cell wall biosynthesis